MWCNHFQNTDHQQGSWFLREGKQTRWTLWLPQQTAWNTLPGQGAGSRNQVVWKWSWESEVSKRLVFSGKRETGKATQQERSWYWQSSLPYLAESCSACVCEETMWGWGKKHPKGLEEGSSGLTQKSSCSHQPERENCTESLEGICLKSGKKQCRPCSPCSTSQSLK